METVRPMRFILGFGGAVLEAGGRGDCCKQLTVAEHSVVSLAQEAGHGVSGDSRLSYYWEP